jgi:hypothetical protein
MFERLLSCLTGKPISNRYAVQVGSEEADRLYIPEATIIESWENGDGSVMFIMECDQDLRSLAGDKPGIYGIQRV